ncbi:MAG: right-handed parallel beta-helix repeat-containing protein [Candidatus Bathyarchaeota archaeon]|nr:right-handed parallel beta-helix repeat-containing protein [Candidatus Bathyarchaeota archaeon]
MTGKRPFALALVCMMFFVVAGLTAFSSPLTVQAYYGQYTPGIYIRSDGQIEPPTAHIQYVNGVYRFTGDIYTGIGVERSDIVLDGRGYRLVGYSSESGVLLENVHNVTLRDISFERFLRGINLINCSGCLVQENSLGNCSIELKQNSTGNQVLQNTDAGVISVEFSQNNTLNANSARCVSILWSQNVQLTNNHLSSPTAPNSSSLLSGNYTQGIAVDNSANCTLTANTIEQKGLGIDIWQSTNLTLTANVLRDNLCGFRLWGSNLETHLHSIDKTNTVNEKPVYFLVNKSGFIVTHNAGWVAAINCNDLTVQNWKSTPNWDGLLLVNTTNANIENCELTNNFNALHLVNSSNCLITHNTLQNSQTALRLDDTTNCTLTENNFLGNYGLFDFWNGATNNTLFHNNFVGNWSGSLLLGSCNRWDNGVEGNYWSSFTGVDLNQDGISDYPNQIAVNSNETDQHPLMAPWGNSITSQDLPASSLLAMPHEYLNYTIYNHDGALWAKVDGLYPMHHNLQNSEDGLPLIYPVPPGTQNIQIKIDGAELTWRNYNEIDPSARHPTDIGDWEMISCLANPARNDFVLEIHYEHPVQTINGSYVFLYDLNISPYLSPASSQSSAHFQIQLDQPFPYINVYTTGLNSTWQPIEYQNTTLTPQQTLTFTVTSHYNQPLPGDIAAILSNTPIPELQPWILLPLLAAITAAAFFANRKKR